jgi:hypothetical protein
MGAVASLSRGTRLFALEIAQIGIFIFGFFFLVGWIAEETTKEHRWNKYRTLFIVMAIDGVAGEWIADIAEFALSEHPQQISDTEIAKLKLDAQLAELQLEQLKRGREIPEGQFKKLLAGKPKLANVTVVYSKENGEAMFFAFDISHEFGIAGYSVSIGPIVPVTTGRFALRSDEESVGGSPRGITNVANKWDDFPWDTQKPLQAVMDAFRDCGFPTTGTVDPKLQE